MNTELYSHPGIPLGVHIGQVLHIGMGEFKKNSLFQVLENTLKVVLLFHDIGKASKYFQNYITSKDKISSDHTKHSEISAIVAYQYLLERGETDTHAMLAYFSIKKHHGNMVNVMDLTPELMKDDVIFDIARSIDYPRLNSILSAYFEDLRLTEDIVCDYIRRFACIPFSARARTFSNFSTSTTWVHLRYVFSLLIWADKAEAIFQDISVSDVSRIWSPGCVDAYKKSFPDAGNLIQTIRKDAYDQVSQNKVASNILSLNLPTGAGKTLTSLKAALSLFGERKARIIYCLPFTSIIDQNYKVFYDILATNEIGPISRALIAHHHLSEFVYSDDEETYHENKAEFLIETWESELVVTTFYQLLHTLFTSKNSVLVRYHRLAKSVLILDEVQNIPARYWPLLNAHLSLIAAELNLKIILVTATMPLIFDREKCEIDDLVESIKWFRDLNRINLTTSKSANASTIDSFANELLCEHEKHPEFTRLVIVNTIQASLDLYDALKTRIAKERLIYLSSNVIPEHRLQRIESIRNGTIKGAVIVSTQVVEAGVDIDVDVVYRDIAPLDCIIQACGRCNRNSSIGSACVHLIRLKDDNREYHKYVYDPTLIDATLSVLRGTDSFPESEFYNIVNSYYQELSLRTTKQISNVLLGHITRCRFHSVDCDFTLYDDEPRKTLFIEINSKAEGLLCQYRHALSGKYKDDYQKRAAIKSAFRGLAPYIITVPEKYMKTEDEFCIVDKSQWRSVYNMETGFIRKNSSSVVVCP